MAKKPFQFGLNPSRIETASQPDRCDRPGLRDGRLKAEQIEASVARMERLKEGLMLMVWRREGKGSFSRHTGCGEARA
jgi:hypothetical protein